MSEKVLTLVVVVEAHPEHRDFVLEQMKPLVAETRKEAGCINYDVHVDNENKNILVFHENWESAAHLEAHEKSAHLSTYRAATEGMVERRHFLRLTKTDF